MVLTCFWIPVVDKGVQINNGLYSIGFLFLYLVIDKMTGMVPNAHALGTLNLVANFFENSAHGTTVVGAFRTSFWVSLDVLRDFLLDFWLMFFWFQV